MKHLLYVLVLILCSTSLYAQRISIFDIDTSAYPKMKAKFYALDAADRLQRPAISELRLTEDGAQHAITNISCPAPQPLENVSVAMSIDISGSMAVSNFGEVPVELGKLTARQLCSSVDMPPSEFALQTCNDRATIIQDFTTNRATILNAVAPVQAGGENDFVEHLLNKQMGLLTIAKTGKYKKIAVLYTDAWWYALTPAEVQRCKDTCAKYSIIFYAVIYSRPESDPNGIKKSLRELAEFTGGALYDGVTSRTAAEDIAARLKHIAQGDNPCIIEWQGDIRCRQEQINVELSWQGLKSTERYTIPSSSAAQLVFTPSTYHFANPPLGIPVTQTITVTARNAVFDVSNITSSHPAFTLTPSNFILQPNQSQTLTLSYTATDSSYAFTRFSVESKLCRQLFFAKGGYSGVNPTAKTLKLTSPNNGEVYSVGSDTVISWEGILPEDTVSIEYSINHGATWDSITNTASGLQYIWHNLPRPASTACLVRIKQVSGSVGSGGNQQDRILTGSSDAVFSLAYSPDGKTIACGTADNLLTIMNATTGQTIRTIFAHNLYVRSVAFSPTGDTIVTSGGTDYSIKLWKVSSGQLLRIIAGHTGDVHEVAFSPDGRLLVSGSSDKTARIWEVATGKALYVLRGHTDGIHGVAYSYDGTTVATGSSDLTVKLWDVATGNELRTLSGHTDGPWNLAFSPDGSTLASGSWDMTVRIWDIATGNELRVMSGHAVQSIAYSPDGSMVATGGLDRNIKLWDVATGKESRTLTGHGAVVNAVDFSPDGSTLVSGSADNTIRLWNIDDGIMQEDQSDTLFSIVEPLAAAQDIMMGQVLTGNAKDSMVVDFIGNTGLYSFTVKDIKLRGSDAGAFRLVSGTPPYAVEPLSAKAAEFRFIPTRVGLHSAEIVIATQSDTLIRTITGIGVAPQLQIESNLIDFGKVNVGQYKDTLRLLTIRNNGATAVTITSTKHGKPNDRDFSTLSGGGAFTLAPGAWREMDVRFAPRSVGRTSGTLELYYNGAGSPAILQLFGEGISSGIAGTGGAVFIPNDSGYAGDRKAIRLMRGAARFDTIAPKFEATLRMQNTILAPSPTATILRSNRSNDSIYVTIAGTLGSEPEIAQLPCIVGLGSVERSAVEILDFSLRDNNDQKIDYQITTQSGLFTVLGICREGGDRLISSAAATQLMHVSPNPSDGTVQVVLHLSEQGTTLLTIFNTNGRVIEQHILHGAGEQLVSLDEQNYTTGVYSIQLVTPTVVKHERLLIYK